MDQLPFDTPKRGRGGDTHSPQAKVDIAKRENQIVELRLRNIPFGTFNEDTAIVNAYDRAATMPKGGGAPIVACGRTTLAFVKKGVDWKIVSAHFSPLPKG